ELQTKSPASAGLSLTGVTGLEPATSGLTVASAASFGVTGVHLLPVGERDQGVCAGSARTPVSAADGSTLCSTISAEARGRGAASAPRRQLSPAGPSSSLSPAGPPPGDGTSATPRLSLPLLPCSPPPPPPSPP